jgi:hypothetical protein
MHCYQHREHEAVGLCKHCSKAVCETCLIDTLNGLACSDYCAGEVKALFQITERAKRIYRIGKKRQLPSRGANVCYAIGLVLFVDGVYPAFTGGHFSWIEALIGSGIFFSGLTLHMAMSSRVKDDANAQ